jgi:hypothetical protein
MPEEVSLEKSVKTRRKKSQSVEIDVPEDVSTSLKPLKKKVKEDVEQEYQVELKPHQEEEVTLKSKVKVTRRTSKVTPETREESTEVTITELPSDDDVKLPRKKSQPEDEAEVTISRRRSEDQPEEVSVSFKPKKKKTKKTEDIEQDFNIQVQPYEEEEVSLQGRVKIPRKKSKTAITFSEESADLSLSKGSSTDEMSEEESVTESTRVSRRSSKQYSKEEFSEERTIKKRPKKSRRPSGEGISDDEESTTTTTLRRQSKSERKSSLVEEEHVTSSEIKLPKRRVKPAYNVQEESVEEEFHIKKKPEQPQKKEEICEEETFDLKIRRKSSVPTYQRQGKFRFYIWECGGPLSYAASSKRLIGRIAFVSFLYTNEVFSTVSLMYFVLVHVLYENKEFVLFSTL